MQIKKLLKYFDKLQGSYSDKNLDAIYKRKRLLTPFILDIAAMADDEVLDKGGGLKKIKEILKRTINDENNKVIFGTDWPMCKTKNHVNLIESLGLEKNIEDKIFYKNAIKLYNLPIRQKI